MPKPSSFPHHASRRIRPGRLRRLQRPAPRRNERRLFENLPLFVWRASERGHWTWSGPQWQAWTGQAPAASLGLGWLDPVHPADRPALIEAWAKAASRGLFSVQHRLRRAADARYIWHHSRAVPVRDERGRVLEWLGTTTDIQQFLEMQERQAVMVAELQHRTRNLIAVVKSIAGQTMATTGPGPAFGEEFGHRLDALARVQGLLSRSDQEPVTIGSLLRIELDALGARDCPASIHIQGPPVRIRPAIVQTLALALHELATNARKYGALSAPDGQLAVTWRLHAEGHRQRLALDWIERGGHPPGPGADARRGYGRELIEQALPYSLDARTAFEHDEKGLRCHIDLPLEADEAPLGP